MRIKNLPAFKKWVKTIKTETVPEQVLRLQKVIVLDLFRRIVLKSPVGNPDGWAPQSLPPPPGYVGGRFRANWQITIGKPATGVIDSTAEPVPSIPALGSIADARRTTSLTVWITNNVPYAERLEMGWSRKQAPGGVVNIALAEVRAAFGG
jgi:hypothetical protein